jgi:hypothetical protein
MLQNYIYVHYTVQERSRDSSVGVATNYGLEDREIGVRVPVGSRIIPTSSTSALGPPNLLSNGHRG